MTHPCDPSNYNDSFEEVLNYLILEFVIDEDDAEYYRDCLYGYLRDYIDFATSFRPPDYLVNRLYKETHEMIDGAINSRKYQINTVEDQKYTLEDMLGQSGVEFDDEGNITYVPDDCYYCEEYIQDLQWANEIIDSLAHDIQFLDEMKKECWLADTRTDKVVCIEKFVASAHTRGPYLPTGCGLPMPENLIYEEPVPGIENAGLEANDLTSKVLTCLREYR